MKNPKAKTAKKGGKENKKNETTEKKGKKGGRNNTPFDIDKMEILGSVKLGDGVRAQVFSYDGNEPKLNFVMKAKKTDKTYPVKRLTQEQAETLFKKSKKLMAFFPEAGSDDDED